jgi:hypothetical protein
VTYNRSKRYVKNGGTQLNTEETLPSKSLTDQILEEMFNSIRNREEFDDKIIDDLMHLATQKQLTNYEKIIESINKEPL